MHRASWWVVLGTSLALALPARAQEVLPEAPAPKAPELKAPAAEAQAKPPSPPPVAKPAAAPKAAKGPAKAAPPLGKKKGKPPRRPAATLPAGADAQAPNEAARRKIAAVRSAGSEKKDPELEALRDADRVLFPKPLPGSTPGFSWDLPKPQVAPGARVHASGVPPAAAADPGLDDGEGDASDAEWIRSLTMPDLPVRLESRVVRYLKFYRDNPKGKAIARVWAKKSGRYVTALKAELSAAGLPSDLVWLSLIESGHNPTIVSPAGAAGLWQFMPDAGRLYGLNVDRWVDERYDPKRATDAAVLYLGDLYRRFGSWELAMAAYNMGYAGLSKAIRKFNTNDYWELCRYEAGIPWETTLYVPKIFAVALVMANKKAFGLADLVTDAPESFEGVVAQAGVTLERIARASGLEVSALETLNPHLLLGRVPPARTKGAPATLRVRVPAGKGRDVSAALAKLSDTDSDLEPYVVRLGDSPGSIAGARGTDRATLASINRLRDDEQIDAGTVLFVPRRQSGAGAALGAGDEVVVVSPREFRYSDRARMFYRVQAGDTLDRISRAFRVGESEILAWNALDPSARLVSGMVLTVWVRPSLDVTGVRAMAERDVRVLVAGSPEFFDYFEGQNGKKRITVEARAGDTLASVGRRHGMSVGWMERINRRSRSKKLEPGDKLVVYVPIGTPLPKPSAPAGPTLPASLDRAAPAAGATKPALAAPTPSEPALPPDSPNPDPGGEGNPPEPEPPAEG